jgi:transcriptional regulator GlxA family with amidase domain
MKRKRIIIFTYEGAELLDVTGPTSVFATAMQLDPSIAYECLAVSNLGGSIEHSSGLCLDTKPVSQVRFQQSDTVLVAGALQTPLAKAVADEILLNAMVRAARSCERFGSVCSGSFILGAAGLLEGKTATTHWRARNQMKRFFKQARFDEDALYVRDGNLWTSAGVTTGIDMSLAMLELDHGAAIKAKVAKELVVYAHRPGSQTQFSDVLNAQIKIDEHYAGLIDWLLERLDHPIRVQDMADYVGMTQRSFYRQFKDVFSESPGKFLEHLKLDHARTLIEAGEAVMSAGSRVGFQSPSAFRTAFKQKFGVSPRHHSVMHRQNGVQS